MDMGHTLSVAPANSAPSGHIPSLNGIRAVSVLLVIASHCGFGTIVPGGLGVTIFFFLSGYLITTLLLREHARFGSISLRRFYARRFIRLSPPFFITLALASTLVFLNVLPGAVTLEGLAAQTFYLANYYTLFWDSGNTTPAGTGIFWSLAVEEHFYLVFPTCLLLLFKGSSRKITIIWSLIAACATVLCWRTYLVFSPGFNPDRTYYATDTRIDSILFGCILAILLSPIARERVYAISTRKTLPILLAGAAGLLATLLIRSDVFRESIRYSLQGVSLAAMFFAIVNTNEGAIHRFLNTSIMEALGKLSYSLYLCHYVLAQILIHNTSIGSRPVLLLVAVLALATAYSWCMYTFVEYPTSKLRARLHTDGHNPHRSLHRVTALDSRFPQP
jgi:peptidoglycan/LPS O-acetylase OafA/YrhL